MNGEVFESNKKFDPKAGTGGAERLRP